MGDLDFHDINAASAAADESPYNSQEYKKMKKRKKEKEKKKPKPVQDTESVDVSLSTEAKNYLKMLEDEEKEHDDIADYL